MLEYWLYRGLTIGTNLTWSKLRNESLRWANKLCRTSYTAINALKTALNGS